MIHLCQRKSWTGWQGCRWQLPWWLCAEPWRVKLTEKQMPQLSCKRLSHKKLVKDRTALKSWVCGLTFCVEMQCCALQQVPRTVSLHSDHRLSKYICFISIHWCTHQRKTLNLPSSPPSNRLTLSLPDFHSVGGTHITKLHTYTHTHKAKKKKKKLPSCPTKGKFILMIAQKPFQSVCRARDLLTAFLSGPSNQATESCLSKQ